MELNDAVRRIVGFHWPFILACIVAGVVGAAALQLRGGDLYTASARLVLDTPDPRSGSESTAIADTAAAIASSQEVVAAALDKVRTAERDPATVSESVSVRALGTSGVLELSVGDRNPTVAAAITNALVRELIDTRVNTNTAKYEETLDTLDRRIQAFTQAIAVLDTQIADLDARAQAAGAANADVIRARRADIARARDLVAEQRSSLESVRDNILTTNALRATPTIISKATAPAHADPANLVSSLLLGGFAGLILGIGIAGLFETVRPTIVGGDAIARDLETVHLGTLTYAPYREQPHDRLASIVVPLRLVAEALKRPHVDLLTADGFPEPVYLAEQLQSVAAGAAENPRAVNLQSQEHGRASGGSVVGNWRETDSLHSARAPSEFRIHSFGLDTPSLGDPSVTALVLVLPKTLRKRELDRLRRLADSASLPILGVITHPS